ncbi:MAG: branched-chain amino acid transporter permease [Enterovirga sp.]|nr:branched-chain amino acid transporter permease [Enterovirga sp.]
MMMPVLPGLAVYALAFGAASSNRGLSLAETAALSGIVFAGASQMVALEIWRDSWTPLTLLTVAVVTATVNARFLLMGAAIQPWLRDLHPARKAIGLFFMADATWLVSTRYAEGGGRDHAVLFGAGILSWIVWVAATIPGYVAGSLVAEPRLYALDLVMPVFFASMAVPLWRGMRVSGAPWLVAAVVALAVQAILPGYAFIVAGALAGALTGALQRDPG